MLSELLEHALMQVAQQVIHIEIKSFLTMSLFLQYVFFFLSNNAAFVNY